MTIDCMPSIPWGRVHMCEVCRTSRRASCDKTCPPLHCCLREAKNTRSNQDIAHTSPTHPQTTIQRCNQGLTHTSTPCPYPTHTPHPSPPPHSRPSNTTPHTPHTHPLTLHTLTPHHSHPSPTPRLLPHKLQLLVASQLFLDSVVHPLDEHVLQPHALQQVGHCGGVAKGVDGPARPGLHIWGGGAHRDTTNSTQGTVVECIPLSSFYPCPTSCVPFPPRASNYMHTYIHIPS